jgi:hypothetical protein
VSKRRPNLPPRERDEWSTPLRAVVPLLKFLDPDTKFIEPCAGPGELIGHLEQAGHRCIGSYDLPTDARTTSYAIEPGAIFITNVPWRRQFGMNDIISNLSDQAPLWALIYADWLFTSRALPLLPRLRAIVVIGRVMWVPNSESSGMENSCWCLFERPDVQAKVRFVGRASFRRETVR